MSIHQHTRSVCHWTLKRYFMNEILYNSIYISIYLKRDITGALEKTLYFWHPEQFGDFPAHSHAFIKVYWSSPVTKLWTYSTRHKFSPHTLLLIFFFLSFCVQTFIGRFRRTMDSSQNAYNEDTSVLLERLDCLERVLFRSGQNGLNAFQLWERGRASQLTASSLVTNYRKRKITELQS